MDGIDHLRLRFLRRGDMPAHEIHERNMKTPYEPTSGDAEKLMRHLSYLTARSPVVIQGDWIFRDAGDEDKLNAYHRLKMRVANAGIVKIIRISLEMSDRDFRWVIYGSRLSPIFEGEFIEAQEEAA